MSLVENVRAQTFLRRMSEARTKPALFTCRTEDGRNKDYVVKFRSQLDQRSTHELIAALIGQKLGLPIPPAAIVDIDSRIAQMIPDADIREQIEQSDGPNFGSLFCTGGYKPILPGMSWPTNLIPEMLDIFSFDQFVQNPDRSLDPERGKSNCLFNGEKFLLYDHEFAFSFLLSLSPPPEPWEIRENGFSQHHLFYQPLRRHSRNQDLPFGRFRSKIEKLTDSFLQSAANSIPASWHNPRSIEKIKAHVIGVRENSERFERGLREALA